MRIAENAAVLVFLIYLKHIDNHGFCIRFRCSSTLFIQWGYGNESMPLNLPLSAAILSIVGMHGGTTKQVVTYSARQNKWIGDSSELAIQYIAICK